MERNFTLFSPILLAAALFASCGPSAEEVQQKVNQQIRQQQEVATKLQQARMDFFELDHKLTMLKADLAVAEDRLGRVSNFQVGRTRGERENQIHDATILVEVTKKNILAVEEQLPIAKATMATLEALADAYK